MFAVLVAHKIGVSEIDSRVDHRDDDPFAREPVDAPLDDFVTDRAIRLRVRVHLRRQDRRSLGHGGEINPDDLVAKVVDQILPQQQLAHSVLVGDINERETTVMPDRIRPGFLEDVATGRAGLGAGEFDFQDEITFLEPGDDDGRRSGGRSLRGTRRPGKANDDDRSEQGPREVRSIHFKTLAERGREAIYPQ